MSSYSALYVSLNTITCIKLRTKLLIPLSSYVIFLKYVKNWYVPSFVSWECDILNLISNIIKHRPYFNQSIFQYWVTKHTKTHAHKHKHIHTHARTNWKKRVYELLSCLVCVDHCHDYVISGNGLSKWLDVTSQELINNMGSLPHCVCTHVRGGCRSKYKSEHSNGCNSHLKTKRLDQTSSEGRSTFHHNYYSPPISLKIFSDENKDIHQWKPDWT